ncbi:MAG: hypothetical protein PHW53_02670 [Patescibacteria group bacterium]|nr:hypothetical protein [Patescibacteria group bacterium]
MLKISLVSGKFVEANYDGGVYPPVDFAGQLYVDTEDKYFVGGLKDRYGDSVIQGLIEDDLIAFFKIYSSSHFYIYYLRREGDGPFWSGHWMDSEAIDDNQYGYVRMTISEPSPVAKPEGAKFVVYAAYEEFMGFKKKLPSTHTLASEENTKSRLEQALGNIRSGKFPTGADTIKPEWLKLLSLIP